MSVDVQTVTLPREQYKFLKHTCSSPYLDLLPDYQSLVGDQIELFVTDAELDDLQERLAVALDQVFE